jgi:type II secretion system protein H
MRRIINIRRSAFTLVELMTVIAIIGIMVAMIIPEMRGTYEDALLRSTGRDLVNVFEIASSRAISLNQMHRVRLDTQSSRYVVERRAIKSGVEEFVPLADVSGCAGELDKRISMRVRRPGEDEAVPAIQTSTEEISFYPDGTADAVLIELQDRAGFRLALRVNPITSRINVLELERE